MLKDFVTQLVLLRKALFRKSVRGMVCVGLSFIRCEVTPGVCSGLSGSVVFVEISVLELTVALKM